MAGLKRFGRQSGIDGWSSHLIDDRGSRLIALALLVLLVTALVLLLVAGYLPAEAVVHGMYLPIVLAAFLYGLPGSVLTALSAGLLLGPWGAWALPDEGSWLMRITFYLAAAAASGWLMASLEGRRKAIIRAQVETLRNFAVAIETEDELAGDHCERVAANAQALGRALGLNSRDLEVLYWAGLLHDIGKVTVPQEILQKPGGLTLEEYLVMRRHARLGANLLGSLDSFKEVSRAVGAHHERWDGSGYPGGLSGEEIPLFGRILAVVDGFEALSSDRPYRRALTPDMALEEIRRNAGAQFDPSLVALYERLYLEGRIVVAQQSEEEEEQPRLELNVSRRQYGEVS